MQVLEAQPDSSSIPVEIVEAVIDLVGDEVGGAEPGPVEFSPMHSNDIVSIRFTDGRTLMIKRGRYEWSRQGFRTSKLAADLLAEMPDIIAPRPITIAESLYDEPLEAYWRIDLPTLAQFWPHLGQEARRVALGSWARLAHRLHSIRLGANGPLHGMVQRSNDSGEWLAWDIGERLLPAVLGEWPEAAWSLERLSELVPVALDRGAGRDGRLIHNDLHMGNVLCRPNSKGVECVGLIDLEEAIGGAPESDIASSQVLHGPYFQQALPGDWSTELIDQYPEELDPWLLGFYRAYHLANFGFYSALVGHDEHASLVARALDNALDNQAAPEQST